MATVSKSLIFGGTVAGNKKTRLSPSLIVPFLRFGEHLNESLSFGPKE